MTGGGFSVILERRDSGPFIHFKEDTRGRESV